MKHRMPGTWPVAGLVMTVMVLSCREQVPVTKENFARAETDLHFARFVDRGAFGRFYHFRQLGIVDQPGMRPNVDAWHSVAVFDLNAGPVTITLPDAGERYELMTIINEDNHVVKSVFEPGVYGFTKDQAGSRYVAAIVRLFVDGEPALDSQIVHGLQDDIAVQQAAPGAFEVPAYDTESQQEVRQSLRQLSASLPRFRRVPGKKHESNPQLHLASTASDWGLPDDSDALLFNGRVDVNDGNGVFQWRVKEVPADGFWSVSVCDSAGQVQQGDYTRYTINNTKAVKDADGFITLQFGGCGDSAANCLPTFPGWQYSVRLYRPRRMVLDGSWAMPPMQRVR